MSGGGGDQEVATEGGGGAVNIGKVLLRGNPGGDIVWGRDMGDFGANGAEVRGRACGFPVADHKEKVKAAEGRVVVTGDGKNSTSGSMETAAQDRCGHETGESGGVGRPRSYFRLLCERDGL